MNFKQILNAGYVYKSYLQLPNTISKPYKCYSLKTLISYPYYFDNDIMPILECTCSYRSVASSILPVASNNLLNNLDSLPLRNIAFPFCTLQLILFTIFA